MTTHSEKDTVGYLEELKEKNLLIESILEHAPIGIWMSGERPASLFQNRFVQEHFRMKPEEEAECARSDGLARNAAEPLRTEETVSFADGTRHSLAIVKTRVEGLSGGLTGVLGLGIDVTAEREAIEALGRSEEKYRIIAENTIDAIWVYDLTEGRFTYFSPSIQTLLGYTPEESLDLSLESLVPSDSLAMLQAHLAILIEQFRKNPSSTFQHILETKHLRKDGSSIWIEISVCPHINEKNEMELVGVSRSIEERKRVEELYFLCYHDQLTGVYNRHHLDTLLIEEMERSDRYHVPLSLVMFDLDHFKQVNDTWGHSVGDEVLTQVASTVTQAIRKTDTLVRFGGEEFVVLLPETPLAAAMIAAEKIRAAVEARQHPVAGHRTISLGVGERLSSESRHHWYMRVDEALYRAKQAGRNRVVASDGSESCSNALVELQWRSEWESGNETIDNQHKELNVISNRLIALSLSGGSAVETIEQVDTLIDHLVKHFATEERILRAAGYSEADPHSAVHRSLVSKALRLRRSYGEGQIRSSAFFSYLVDDVILGHLLLLDVKFFPTLKDAAARQSESQAGLQQHP